MANIIGRNSLGLLTLDIATSTGWAFYDLQRSPSAIECGTIDLKVKGARTGEEQRDEQCELLDMLMCERINEYRPDVIGLERPLAWIKPNFGGGRKRRGMFKDDSAAQEQDADSGGGVNSATVLALNQLYATANCVARHKARLVIRVSPKTWQTIIADCPGANTKEKAIEFCRMLRIEIPPELNKVERGDAADASAIAVWCAGHSQQLKMLGIGHEQKDLLQRATA